MIDIDRGDRQRLAVSIRALDFFRQPLLEVAQVAQPCDRIDQTAAPRPPMIALPHLSMNEPSGL